MLRGRCACKAVGYEFADEFVVAYNCHCSNCRAMTGSAFLPWGEIEPERLRVESGTGLLPMDGDAHAATQCAAVSARHSSTGRSTTTTERGFACLRVTHRRADALADRAHVRRLQ